MKMAFQLSITVQIQKVGVNEENRLSYDSGERLSVNEDHLVSAETFAEVCSILGKFHELAAALSVKSKR